MRILVCGGRDYHDYNKVVETLSKYENVVGLEMCAGMARGADTLAEEWAMINNIPFRGYPADWKQYGLRAGMIRNQKMLDEFNPDLVIAFPGGVGTAAMVRIARAKGTKVFMAF